MYVCVHVCNISAKQQVVCVCVCVCGACDVVVHVCMQVYVCMHVCLHVCEFEKKRERREVCIYMHVSIIASSQ